MADITVADTTAQLSGKTIPTTEGDFTITGLHTFSRAPSPPFAVGGGSAVVSELDADKLDGLHGPASSIVGISDSQTLTNKTLTAPAISNPTVTGTLAAAAATLSTTLAVTGDVTLSAILRFAATEKIGHLAITGLANNGTASLAFDGVANLCALILIKASDNACALFFLSGASNGTVEIADSGSAFSVTATTGSSYNIYWSSGNARYELENKSGSTRNFEVLYLVMA